MTSTSPRLPSKINVPRLVLWLASLVVAVVGYVLVASANAKEAVLYTSGKADYPKLFTAQSTSTVGGMLIVAGVFGALLALASLAITWRPAVTDERAVLDGPVLGAAEFRDGELDDTPVADNGVEPEAAPGR